MKNRIYLLIFAIVIILSSCSTLVSKMYGIRQLDGFDEQRYNNFITKLKGHDNLVYIISDTVQYLNVIRLGQTLKEKNDLGQPVQILYFENDILKSFHANCYARGGLKSINWNTKDRFSVFLPISATESDSLKISLNDYIRIYPTIKRQKKKTYTVLIFWTLMLEKISYSAIETVLSNLKQFEKKDETLVILINSDKYFSSFE